MQIAYVKQLQRLLQLSLTLLEVKTMEPLLGFTREASCFSFRWRATALEHTQFETDEVIRDRQCLLAECFWSKGASTFHGRELCVLGGLAVGMMVL
jgi:hypothetical protein